MKDRDKNTSFSWASTKLGYNALKLRGVVYAEKYFIWKERKVWCATVINLFRR